MNKPSSTTTTSSTTAIATAPSVTTTINKKATTPTAPIKSPSNNFMSSNLIAHDEENNRLVTHKSKLTNDDDAIDDNNAKSLSKNEIIKRFDNKFKNDNRPSATVAPVTKTLANDNGKRIDDFDDALVTVTSDNIDVIDNNAIPLDDDIDDDQLPPIDMHANVVSSKNGYENGSNNGQTPPKPLPRTSRNNSVSSDQGFVMVGDEIQSRPIAKPRNISNTGYKVPSSVTSIIHLSLFSSLAYYTLTYRFILFLWHTTMHIHTYTHIHRYTI